MNEISEIVNILNRIASPDSRKETLYLCNRLRNINKENWNTYYEELINELGKDNKIITNVDYQVFWYECLGFPKVIGPNLRDFQGNTLGCDGILESDFNEVSGFHDANLNYVTYQNGNLTFFIDMYGDWGATNKEKYDYILGFEDVFAIYYKKEASLPTKLKEEIEIGNLIGKPIISIDELPAIKYILNSFNIEYNQELIEYRLFNIYSGMSHVYGLDNIIVFAKKWDLKHRTEEREKEFDF